MIKRSIIILLLVSSITLFPMDIRVYFSPNGGCLRAIVQEINRAKKNIKILAYRFTSRIMIRALAKARQRGVEIEAVLDGERTRDRFSRHEDLKKAGVELYLDYSVKHMHDKVMMFDSTTVITGSYNFTTLAERGNSENILVIRSPYIYRRYLSHFHQRKIKSRRF